MWTRTQSSIQGMSSMLQLGFKGFNHQDMIYTWIKVKTSVKQLLNTESCGMSTWLVAVLESYIRDKTCHLFWVETHAWLPAQQPGGAKSTNEPNIPYLLVSPG